MYPERFKTERKKLGLTQEQLAKKLNTSRSNVANWENGQNNPSVDMLFKCSDLFKCSIPYLAGYTDIKTGDFPNDDYIPEFISNQFESNEIEPADELEILFSKYKSILTESDKNIIKTIIEERQKAIDKELGEN